MAAELDLQRFPVFAYIPARDLARARRFYEQQVGLAAQEETKGGVVYAFAGGTACFLYSTPNAGTSKASQLFWEVQGIEGLVAALKARGVAFEHYDIPGAEAGSDIVTDGGVKAAWFKDSEGNIMALIESL
jgi:predicted enzyme related to lactoylglutathione lyase